MHAINARTLDSGRIEITSSHVTPHSRHFQDTFDTYVRLLALKKEMPLIASVEQTESLFRKLAHGYPNRPKPQLLSVDGFYYNIGYMQLLDYQVKPTLDGTKHVMKLIYTPPRNWLRTSKKTNRLITETFAIVPVAIGSYRARTISPDVLIKRMPCCWCITPKGNEVYLPETVDATMVSKAYETTKPIDEEWLIQQIPMMINACADNQQTKPKHRRRKRKDKR